MLPGNLQYWDPCIEEVGNSDGGTKSFKIIEPIHFSGPAPDAPRVDQSSSQVTTFQPQPQAGNLE